MANSWLSFVCSALTQQTVKIEDQSANFVQPDLDLH